MTVAVLAMMVIQHATNCHAQETPSVAALGQSVVVKLFGAGVGTLDSYGSGVLISDRGHVATVWNHLVNTGYLTAVVPDGRRFSVSVVGTSFAHDLAILKLECDDEDRFECVDGKSGAEAVPGESVMAFSNMFHVATGNEGVSVVHGVVACVSRLNAGFGKWQFPVQSPVYIIDAVINNSGAAGGLLTNSAGIPIGLIGREIRHRETGMWVNYAVPWTLLKPAMIAILEGRKLDTESSGSEKPAMVSDRRLTADFGFTLLPGILPRTPAYIDRVIPESPAATSGLERGDLVLMVGDRVIQSTDELRTSLAEFRKGQRASLTISRNSQLVTVTLPVP